ncbi:DNA adenine methylase [Stappia stellulata]|uniref:DNA adenine methylase n=1 Tax=Stappia stellulata TaxID=71235 RepID=UPI003990B0CF
MFFRLAPETAVLSDANSRLIELYNVVKVQPIAFKTPLKRNSDENIENYYHEVKATNFFSELERATQYLHLNSTCYNGLYCENKLGQFKVPIGTKDTVVFETDDFYAWSAALQNANLICCDFELTIDGA